MGSTRVFDVSRGTFDVGTESAREARLRRLAQRQGLKLIKSRRRTEGTFDFGRYWLTDSHTSVLLTDELGVSLDEIEHYLTDEDQ